MRKKRLKTFKIFLSLVLLTSLLNFSSVNAVATEIPQKDKQTFVLDDATKQKESIDTQENDFSDKNDRDNNTKTKENIELIQVVEGVKIKLIAEAGVLKEGTVLKVEKISSKAVKNTVEKSLDKEKKLEDILAYDITLLLDGKEVQPNGKVKVEFSKLPFSKERNKEIAVYHVLNKKAEDVESKISSNGQMVDIETKHFSVYAISQVSQKTSLNVSLKFVNSDSQTINKNVNGTFYAFITGANNDRITKEIKVIDGQGVVTTNKIYDQNGQNSHDLSAGYYDVKLASRKNQDINETTRYDQNNVITHSQGSKINGCFEIDSDEKIMAIENQDNEFKIKAKAKGNILTSYDAIKNSLETVTRFGAFALDYIQTADVESTIAAKNANITADYGFSNNNFDFINNKIVVNKTYRENGQPAKNKEIILRLYRKGSHYLVDEICGRTDDQGIFSGTFEKITDGTYNVVEVINGQEVSKNMIIKDSDGKDIRVTLSKSEVTIGSGYSNISYFDSINEGIINKSRRPGVIVVNNREDYNFYKDKMPSGLELVLAGEDGYKKVIDFDKEFVSLSNLSKHLSNIVSSKDVKVYYFDIDEFNNNNGGPRNYESDGKSYIVVNVDASKYKDSIGINGDFSIDGKHISADFGKEDNAIDTKILFNFYTEENGIRTPYSGNIRQQSVFTGVILAPDSHYIGAAGNLGGTIIAKKYEHISGEIHQEKISQSVVETVNLINEKVADEEVLGELEIIKTTKGGTTPAGTEFIITGPNGYSTTVKYSEFEDGKYVLKDIPLGEYIVREKTETGAVAGYTLKVNGEQKATLNKDELKGSVELINEYMPTKIVINKVDDHGDVVVGARLSVMDNKGNRILSFTTRKKAYEVTGKLEVGKTYTLHEDQAPAGYEKAKDVEFTVLGDGQTTNVRMIDIKRPEIKVQGISLILYKVDQDMNFITGATFKLIRVENGIEKTIGTQSGGPRYEFKDLKDGIYRIYETKAPDGYEGLATYFEIEIKNGEIYYDGILQRSFTVVNTNDGTIPEVLGDEIDNTSETEVLGDEVGDKSKTKVNGVETSDDQNLYGYGTIAIISMLGIFFLIKRKKAKNDVH